MTTTSRSIRSLAALSAVLLAGAGVAPLRAQSCPSPARYQVRVPEPGGFVVEAEFGAPTTELAMRFSAAEGRAEGQAASVRDLAGWAGDEPVAVTYAGEGRWTADRPLTRVRYRLVADHDEATWLDGGRDEVAGRFGDAWYFIGNAFFLTDPGWPACPVPVRFDLPDGWSLLAPWPGRGGAVVAGSPDALTDNAFALGRMAIGAADAGTMRVSWVVDERLPGLADRVAPLLTALPGTFAEYFGGTPADRYAVVVFRGPHMDGGAFRESFTLQLGEPVRPVDELVWAHGIAHEMIHLWIGNHVRGAPADSLSWFTEGFTDYLAIRLMHGAGRLDDAMLAQRLANVVRRVRLGPMLSPGVGLAAAGAEKHRHWARVYGGGAMVAMLVDAADADGFRAALRDLVAHADQPWTQAALLARLDMHTGGAATRAFALVDEGPDVGGIVAWLAGAGADVTGFSPDEVYVRFAGACEPVGCVPAFLARDRRAP